MELTDKMHDAVLNSEVGKFIDRLIREEVARGGDTAIGTSSSVIQELWSAFMSGAEDSKDSAATEDLPKEET